MQKFSYLPTFPCIAHIRREFLSYDVKKRYSSLMKRKEKDLMNSSLIINAVIIVMPENLYR